MILKYFIAIHMKCNIYKKYLNAQKMHSSLNICHLLSANSLPLIEIFFADLSFVYQEQTALFYESKVDFHGLSKEIPNNIKKLRFVRFLPIFSIRIFSAQMQTSGKVFMWLNSNYECQ